MLQKSPIYSYVPVKDLARARSFYEGKLGFANGHEQAAGVHYDCAGGTAFFVYLSGGAGTNKASQAFWQVEDLEREVAELKARGVTFEEYDMSGIKTHNSVAVGGGAKSAWFTDSEGNVMALIQSVASPNQAV